MASTEATRSIAFQVRDAGGQPYDVLLRVDEQTGSGTLALTPATGAPQEYALTRMQKSRDGKTVTCRTGPASATLTVEDGDTPARLHLVARVFVPVLDTTYTFSPAEQERLVAWLKALQLRELA